MKNQEGKEFTINNMAEVAAMRKVCVTGGEGFIGSYLVKTLLLKGYVVHATVLSISDSQFLLSLAKRCGKQNNLKLFEANLWDDGSFDSAIEGCVGVFHLASPVLFGSKDPEREVVECAVRGTLNVLRSCQKAKTVKRFVYTSSIAAALHHTDQAIAASNSVDETCWSSPTKLREKKTHDWDYAIAKTEAEKAAIEFGKENNIEVISLLPVYVCGPWECPSVPYSVSIVMSTFTGDKEKYEMMKKISVGFVHVEDVCEAEISLMEDESAHGRYICCAENKGLDDFVGILHKDFPQYASPLWKESKGKDVLQVSKKRLHELGFVYKHDLTNIIHDSFDKYVECGLLPPLLN